MRGGNPNQEDSVLTNSSMLPGGVSQNLRPGMSPGTRAETFRVQGAADEPRYAAQRAAWAQAETALFIRDRILSIASHDLRGPLNAIHSWAHVLERKLATDDATLQRALDGVRTGVEQQVKMIESLLDAPRAATRSMRLETGSVVLCTLLDSVVSNLRATFAQARSVQFSVEPLVDESMTLSGDEPRLWLALWAMLAFAVDASAAASTVGLRSLLVDGMWQVDVTYRPDSPALLNESICHAFEAFARAEALETRARDGVPMALSLPKRIAEAHGGEFSRQPAEPGGWVRIVLSVPLAGPGPEVD
jgi:signal transduction histidine kinase